MRLLILGATGMLGSKLFLTGKNKLFEVFGTVRDIEKAKTFFDLDHFRSIIEFKDANDLLNLESIVDKIKPDILINCIGIVKQSSLSKDPIESITINSLLPHRLECMCSRIGSKLIHISTDCVFDGGLGNYNENDIPNAYDLYGRSKLLGEVSYGCGLTLRTSIIGHEISKNKNGLVDWFLSADQEVYGYSKAIFSGLTTLELSKFILDYLIPANLTSGTYHISSDPIDKYNLLSKINSTYKLDKKIIPDDEVIIDRSLDSSNLKSIINYQTPSWDKMIGEMFLDYQTYLK